MPKSDREYLRHILDEVEFLVDSSAQVTQGDRLIHQYFGVDYEIVWDVVKNEIPALKNKLEEFLR